MKLKNFLMMMIIGFILLIIVIVISCIRHTLVLISCLTVIVSAIYILYLMINKPLKLDKEDNSISYYSLNKFKMSTSVVYPSKEDVPERIKETEDTFFYRNDDHVYMRNSGIVYQFSKYHCNLQGEQNMPVLILDKSNGITQGTKLILAFTTAVISIFLIAGFMAFRYTEIKYESEFKDFYDHHMTYIKKSENNDMLSTPILYNLNMENNPENIDIPSYFKDDEFTLVLCEDNQGGYLFAKCICINSQKYSVDILNLNKYLITSSGENVETALKNSGSNYDELVTLMEDTFKMRFQQFIVLKYDALSELLTADTITLSPPKSILQAENKLLTASTEMTDYERIITEYYQTNQFAADTFPCNYASAVAAIMTAEENYLSYVKAGSLYQQSMEELIYKLENDFLLSVLKSIASGMYSGDTPAIYTNISWSKIDTFLLIANYKGKSLYHSYYSDNNLNSVPYTANCMWYEQNKIFTLYTSENYIDSLMIKWLYYSIGR